uniref:Large ribosomal subunit protein uL13c n=2 Tax=Gelidium TaxID=2811 RepID=A0A411FT50_9FLOR|nr:ribosomal protein L13 [Gelidium coulteri]YP_009565355.1 ribosomal protein L13 [Gelidium sinicola]QBA96306.1 ribosomal protein L13 [Gelidium coulteri]QBA96706.1 ribosomal protein L13 [Gelidium sinicola]
MNKTYVTSMKDDQNKWYIVDAYNKNLGRLSTEVATILRGKNRTNYMPHIINNAYVIVINAENITITGKKDKQKLYKRHSGYPGGLKVENFTTLQNRLPERIIEKSIKGMLPKNSLGKQLFNRLKVYRSKTHPHSAQQPEQIFSEII